VSAVVADEPGDRLGTRQPAVMDDARDQHVASGCDCSPPAANKAAQLIWINAQASLSVQLTSQ
jgi:hypothetical protein